MADRERLRSPHGMAGGTEVKQDGPHAAGVQARQVEVLGFEVAVQEALGMNSPQTVEDREDQLFGLILGQAPAPLIQVLGQREPLIVVHHQIGRAVGLEEVPHPHDVGVIELGQGARLQQELLQAEAEQLAIVLGMDGDGGPVAGSPGQVPGQKLLDGHPGLEVEIPAQVGDTKAAGLAQHPANQKLFMEPGAVRQNQRAARGLLIIAAVGAGVGPAFVGEATGAECSAGLIHRSSVRKPSTER
jgi:hypothetical protein